jgi:hypothetical protein
VQSRALALSSVLALIALGCQDASEPAGFDPAHTGAQPHWAGETPEPGVGGAGCGPGRSILPGELTNARDLGGTELGDGRLVACGQLLRGAPLSLDTDGCRKFEALGVKSVVDLRIDSESGAVPDADCVSARRVAAPFPVPYGLSAEDYLRDLHATDSLAIAFRTFGDADAYPVYFHCTYGRDRTGVIGALLLLVLGATRETVMAEYLLSQPFVGAYPDALDAVLDEVQARGGAEMVLQDAGISAAELATLRQRAIAE